MTVTVTQGRSITLPVEWLEFSGGPAAVVTGVTIEIVPVAGPPAVIGPTSVGVVHVATGLDTYLWQVDPGQAPADYVVIWRGVDAQIDAVTASEIVTVTAALTGAYATVAELAAAPYNLTPANAQLLLDRASRDVDRALLCSVYDPADPDVIAALKAATLEQVAAALDAGDSSGLGASVQSFTVGRLQVTRKQGGEARRPGQLHPQAFGILAQAGLTGHGPQSG